MKYKIKILIGSFKINASKPVFGQTEPTHDAPQTLYLAGKV